MTMNRNIYDGIFSLTEKYQPMHGRTYDDYRVGIEEAIKSDPRAFFGYVDLEKKSVGYPLIMHFDGRLASGPDNICDLFADFMQRNYADDVWVPSAFRSRTRSCAG
jgi:hypothetical protein